MTNYIEFSFMRETLVCMKSNNKIQTMQNNKNLSFWLFIATAIKMFEKS